MGKEPEQVLNEFKERLSSLIGLKIELLKLNAYERIANIVAILSHSLILMLLAFFAVLFIFFCLAFYFGELLNSTALGFLIVAGIYILTFIIVYYNKRGVKTAIMNIVIAAIQNKEEDDNYDKGKHKHHPTDTEHNASVPETESTATTSHAETSAEKTL